PRFWPCSYKVSRHDMDVGGSGDLPLSVCADTTDKVSDVEEACEDKCEDKWCEYGVTSSFPFIDLCFSTTCTILATPTPSGGPCPGGSDAAGPAREIVAASMEGVVTHGSDTAHTTLSGPIYYTISSACTG